MSKEWLDMKESRDKTCCFTGHRKLPCKNIERIIKRLHEEVNHLIRQGVTDFISGGALGFDQIAASLIISKKQQGANIRLIFALPCRNQDEKWTDKQKQLYRSLLRDADEIRCISEKYTPNCMKNRNLYIVDNSAYCICAMLKPVSGTGQTVRYAQQQGLEVVNVACG